MTEPPPLGCRPRWLIAELRADELTAALIRYRNAHRAIPEEWVQELGELTLWLATRRAVLEP